MTEAEVRDRLRIIIAASGLSKREWARRHGVQPSGVSETLHGRGSPRPAILRALGLRRRDEEYEEAVEEA